MIVWTSALDDSWNDLPRRPVYLPLVHQLVQYLAQFEPSGSWQTVGQVVDVGGADESPRQLGGGHAVREAGDARMVRSSSTSRASTTCGPSGGAVEGTPAQAIAVNIDPAESDLTPIDPNELVAAVTGRAAPVAAPAADRKHRVRRQRS